MSRSKKIAKPLSRRLFLRGAGTVALGLPFLETFTRIGSRAGAQPPADSFAVWVRQGNGVAQAGNGEPERYWLRETGPLTRDAMAAESDRALSELAPYADQLLAVAGLRFAFPGNGCGHSGGGNQCLTAARVSDDPSGNESLAMGESVDNRVARELHPEREPLTLFTGRKSGYLPEVMSYRGPRDLRAAENDPWNAYMRMTGLGGMDIEVINRIRERRMSVNDLVRDQLDHVLSGDLSSDDRRRLDLHLSSIRDLEVLMTCNLPEMAEMEMEGIDPLSGGNYQRVTEMHMDLIALGIACGYVRSATLQLGNGNDGTQHTIPGYRGGEQLPRFHQISHRIFSDGSDGPPIEGAQEMHGAIDKMHLRLFRHLIDRLSEYASEAGGPLLDRGVVCMTNDLGHGVSHNYRNVPFIFAGSAGGNLDVGKYVDVSRDGEVTHNKMFNTILSAIGVRKDDGSLVDDFGDSSLENGFIPEMIAADAPDF